MKYGLSVRVRDQFEPVNAHIDANQNDATRLHTVLEAERNAKKATTAGNTLLMLENGEKPPPLSITDGSVQPPARTPMPPTTAAMLMASNARAPTAQRQKTVCSLFEKGTCAHGACSYTHRDMASAVNLYLVGPTPVTARRRAFGARYYKE